MPELPEVETVKRTLNELIKGKQIQNVTVWLPRIIQRPDDTQAFAHMLAGHSVVHVERRGKFLRFVFDGLVMVSHLRMEGRGTVFSGVMSRWTSIHMSSSISPTAPSCVTRMCVNLVPCICSSRVRIFSLSR